MDERYWDKIAPNYNELIFDTLKNDKNGIIVKYIDRFADNKSVASDFGCGVGRYLKILGVRFKTVYAVDISNRCLELAREANKHLDNIVYIKGNLADSRIRVRKACFAISINMLIMPSLQTRIAILKNLSGHIIKGGYLLLVVPSLESALYSNFRLLEWNHKTGSKHGGVSATSLVFNGSREFSVVDGILNWGEVLTKHFLKEELIILLNSVGLKIISVDKVEYSWATEFTQPPRWMKQPYPWDWLLLCRRA